MARPKNKVHPVNQWVKAQSEKLEAAVATTKSEIDLARANLDALIERHTNLSDDLAKVKDWWDKNG